MTSLTSPTSSVAESTPGSAPNICHTCTEPISTHQFIRVGVFKFHKDHFTCTVCSTSLHEKKFHHKDSKFYCANDYINKFCHTCRHCQQKIATGSVIQAFGGYYHPEHFVCAEKKCGKPFKNGKYYEADDQPYCDEHFFLLTAEKCQSCGEGVKDADMVRVQGKGYHSHCLSCCHCGLALAKKGSIFQKDGNVYCRNDYLNFFCKRCTACADHILKHCVGGGQGVNTRSGAVDVERVDADVDVLGCCGAEHHHDTHAASKDERGLRFGAHGGAFMQPNEQECLSLGFIDGRSVVCTPSHRILTPAGYVCAGDLVPGRSEVMAGVRLPRDQMPTAKDAEQQSREHAFALALSDERIPALHMRESGARRRSMAYARLAGFVCGQAATSVVRLDHSIDAAAFRADLALLCVQPVAPSAADADALSVALPSTLFTPSTPAFLLDQHCPAALQCAFLSGLSGAAASAPALAHDDFAPIALPASAHSMLHSLGISTLDVCAFEDRIGFAYACSKQQRLALAAAFAGSRQLKSPSLPSSASASSFLAACHASSFFTADSAVDRAALSLPLFQLGLVSVALAPVQPVYDVLDASDASFQVQGVVVHNCVSVNDEFYHPECLQCSYCRKKLDKYICISGYLRCNDHTELAVDPLKCSQCSKLIEGEVVLSVGKKLHPECFKCAFCSKGLQKASAKLKDDKLCCEDCMKKKDANLMAKNAAAAAAAVANGAGAIEGEAQVQVGNKPAAAAAAVATPTPVDSKSGDWKLYEKPKPVKGAKMPAIPAGKIEWKKGELIGKGSFGKVYMAMNSATGELIAVKQVRLMTTEEQEQAAAIQNEIGLMENLRHPNIVSLLGTQRNGNKLNILMEYVPGKSLDSLLEKFGGFSEKVIRSYTKQLLEALAYCHSNRVVHRDIKGKNILIDTKGNLKLADFGSAKRFTNVMSKDAPSLSYNYTPLWTAPEVLVGDYNSKVDIWSLGCVIIEMASAKPPWSEQNFENPFRALYHIGNSDAIPKIPESLSAIGMDFVKQCLRRNPDERPDAAFLLKQEWLSGIESLPGNDDDSGSDGEEGGGNSNNNSDSD